MSGRIILIAAVARNGVIGVDNQLPWHIPDDLQYFKRTTLGKPIIMGRKNYDSLGRPLPKRRNIILTRQTDFHPVGCDVVHSVEESLRAVENEPESFIIGGGEIYRLFFDYADALYLTEINADVEGDITFPSVTSEWVMSQEPQYQQWHTAPDGTAYRFTRYSRSSAKGSCT